MTMISPCNGCVYHSSYAPNCFDTCKDIISFRSRYHKKRWHPDVKNYTGSHGRFRAGNIDLKKTKRREVLKG
jgi:hypothetical protein